VIAALDSAGMPAAAAVQAAKAAGVRVWSGYLATRWPVGLYAIWSRDAFDRARALGGRPIAFCSGWDDPVACRQLAARWGVRLCLDVEAFIRPDGPWVQDWLDQSGAGLYGNWPVFPGRRAAFYIMAWFTTDPGREWPTFQPQPAGGALGWQWQGSHQEFGMEVDRSWLADSFGVDDDSGVLHPSVKNTLARLSFHRAFGFEVPTIGLRDAWAAKIADDGSNMENVYVQMQQVAAAAGAMTPPPPP
jgi:hypothetical protein